jgi:hypothetical protein
MNEQEAIFVPIEYERYKQNKISLLKMRLLDKKIKEQIEGIKMVSEDKSRIRRLLSKSLTELKKEFLKFKKELPELKNETEKKIKSIKTYHPDTKFTKIDSELRQIQAKLNSLRNE